MSESLEEFLNSLKPESVVEIFTDGACSGNPGPGGWGAVLRHDKHEAEVLGGEAQTTNNRMEMLAAINSVGNLPAKTKVTLYTDSQYLKDGVTRWMINWKKNGWLTADKKPVKNKDLWEKLDQLIVTHTIEWKWVRGHDGHPENERADALARKGVIAQRMAL
ncbi:MAG: ribonuclease HI [Alphaproteobacteria bacterium]|nr:ribonuclease HI [Alphaproteobacteria bacterium]